MKRQDLVKYRQQNQAELQAEVNKLSVQLVETKLQQSLGQQKNVRGVKNLRDDIARLKTIIREKQLAGEPVGEVTVKKETKKAAPSKTKAAPKKSASKSK